MEERLLQFIWKYQHFNSQDLRTRDGEPLEIVFPGRINTGQGPDFLDAQIRIGNRRWFGNIELHILSSGWKRHAHHLDPHYRNVILHVVWSDDAKDATPGIPVLVLQDRIPKHLLGRYTAWMNNIAFVPCAPQISLAGEAVWTSWKNELVHRRLEKRTLIIKSLLAENNQHWEETLWWLMARSFGANVNAAGFEAIARTLPLSLLTRHQGRPDQLEALLLGQAGLLGYPPDDPAMDQYARHLQREYIFLTAKYRLPAPHVPILLMGMRPGNFPAVRLAQLAALLEKTARWFSRVKDAATIEELLPLTDIRAGAYWDDHYSPGSVSVRRIKRLGQPMRDNLLINAFIPILYAYGTMHRILLLQRKALDWLHAIQPEKNARIAAWGRLGVKYDDAADTQALLELRKHYCLERKCLDCTVGNAILNGPGPRPGSS